MMVARPSPSDLETQQQTAATAVKPRVPTVFEQRLYAVCRAIPKGKVATYGTLAVLTKSSPRAVGQALKRNPYAPEVPCHRVVASSLDIGGFKGDWGDTAHVRNKQSLLQSEGVLFEGSKVASPDFVVPATALSSA